MANHAVLLMSCPDQKGITAAVTDFVFRRCGNIIHVDQHTDKEANVFFMRIEWEIDACTVPRENLAEEFQPLAEQFAMSWQLHFTDTVTKVAVFVSKHLHCLYDVLFRYQSGQLPCCEIVLIVSNHEDARPIAEHFGVEFLYIPVTPETKVEAESRQLAALKARHVDLIALARYHQILTQNFVSQYPNKIINVHHSFLPAFVGGNPYTQAFEKGVKIIGATSHYVIEDLDQGPIIEQGTTRIDHRYSVQDLVEAGQDVERIVFSHAIRWHLEHKILCYSNKTVIFD